MASQIEEALQWKEKGNGCVREGKHEEAVLHYTTAIKLDPNNATLYSNRSLAFLKLQQYYHAYTDALDVIRLKPDWAKGYFRLGEVELSAYQPAEALLSYGLAFKLQPTDPTIIEAVNRARVAIEKEKRAQQTPWVGAGVGIIVGVCIVLADQLFTSAPSVSHPLLMALLTISVAALGYGFARALMYHTACQNKSLLEPPVDLLEEFYKDSSNNDENTMANGKSHTKLTKAQARAKLRRAKT